MEKKYLIGSRLINLDNNKDEDYLIISDEYDYKRLLVDGKDTLYRSTDNILKSMRFESNDYRILIYNYQMDKDIIGQNFPIEYHILDYKNKLVELLKKIIKEKHFNFDRRCVLHKKYCSSKNLYHLAYNMFICQNNSVVLTEEQKEVIQKLHDRIMPISYLDEMEKIINSL